EAAKRLHGFALGDASACDRDTACSWRNVTAVASYDIVRVKGLCGLKINQQAVCIEPPMVPKVPEAFFIDGNLHNGSRWVFFRVDRQTPRFAFKVGGGLVSQDELAQLTVRNSA